MIHTAMNYSSYSSELVYMFCYPTFSIFAFKNANSVYIYSSALLYCTITKYRRLYSFTDRSCDHYKMKLINSIFN